MDVANQNALQERPHNMHNVDFLERQWNAAMKNYSAPSNLKHEQSKENTCCLTHICFLPAFTDENCGEYHGES